MVEQQDEGLLLDIDEEEFDLAGSKFITLPLNAKVGDIQTRKVEITPEAGWDSVGTSVKFTVVIIEEGPDKGKEDKLSFGIAKNAIWKGKEACAALIDPGTGKVGVDLAEVFPTVETADGGRKKKLMPLAIIGKQTYGVWTVREGWKGGIEDSEKVTYPKLESFSPTPIQTESLGI